MQSRGETDDERSPGSNPNVPYIIGYIVFGFDNRIQRDISPTAGVSPLDIFKKSSNCYGIVRNY